MPGRFRCRTSRFSTRKNLLSIYTFFILLSNFYTLGTLYVLMTSTRSMWPRDVSRGKYSILTVPMLYLDRQLLPRETRNIDLATDLCPDEHDRLFSLKKYRNEKKESALLGVMIHPFLVPSLFPRTCDGIPKVGVVAEVSFTKCQGEFISRVMVHGLQRFNTIESKPHQHVLVKLFGKEEKTFEDALELDLTNNQRLSLLLSESSISRQHWLDGR